MDFTGGISSLVQGRLGGTAANVSEMQVVSFAPTSASGRTNEAFAAISALGYGAERARPPARAWTYADAPYNVWASGFGGVRGVVGRDNVEVGRRAARGEVTHCAADEVRGRHNATEPGQERPVGVGNSGFS